MRALLCFLLCAGAWAAEGPPAEAQTASFGVYWPPQDPATASGTKRRALLDGEVALRLRSSDATGWVASICITLSRPTDDAGREFWNSRLAFPEYDWMSSVRVWDAEHRWLWPNLAYLLRLHGKERVERYGGVDPGKGIDNDFAAVLIRKFDSPGPRENNEAKRAPPVPLVSAEWYAADVVKAGRETVAHAARSDEFTLHLGDPGQASSGSAGIWLIYADFLGAKPPAAWPQEPEFAGGILAFYEVHWTPRTEGPPEVRLEQKVPRQATGFNWERWAMWTRATSDPKKTAVLTDRPPPRQPVRKP